MKISDQIVDKIKPRILFSTYFPENRAVYEIICKSMMEPDRPQITINTAH